jgi:hypothetical protein
MQHAPQPLQTRTVSAKAIVETGGVHVGAPGCLWRIHIQAALLNP